MKTEGGRENDQISLSDGDICIAVDNNTCIASADDFKYTVILKMDVLHVTDICVARCIIATSFRHDELVNFECETRPPQISCIRKTN